jgi:hypothetical protein
MSYSTIEQVGDNIYVNVVISSSSLNTTALEIAAEYQVTQTIPILNKCDDYYLSVIRFDVPLNDLPLFIMPIIPNQTIPNPNLTPFVIGITTGGIDYPQPVIYVSETGSGFFPPPIQNKPTQVITPYYYVFEYQNFITAINTALALSFVASGLSGNNPYFYLNTSTEQISLVVDVATFAVTATTAIPKPVQLATIFMNIQLQSYLSAFQVLFVGPSLIGKDYQFDLTRFGLDNTIPPFNGVVLMTQKQFSQEYSTLSLWSSLKKILLISNSIPINSEYTPTNTSGISSTLPVISDFTPQIEMAGQNRSIAYYNPTTQYRLVDLKSSERLNTIDIKIYWQDLNQNVYPLLILNNQQASIKLGFFKKSLYKCSIPLLKK